MLTFLIENHVLTVLIDIRRKKLSGCDNNFGKVQDTEGPTYYVRKLVQDVELWIARLESYLQAAFVQGKIDSPAVQIAQKLHDEHFLPAWKQNSVISGVLTNVALSHTFVLNLKL